MLKFHLEKLQKNYLSDLGFFDQVIVNLPERAEPLIPDPWRMVNTESISYGYGLSISPLHLALATSTVLNGGYIIEPSLVKKDNQLFKNQIFSERTSEIMRYLLNRVVDEGTAKDVQWEISSTILLLNNLGERIKDKVDISQY